MKNLLITTFLALITSLPSWGTELNVLPGDFRLGTAYAGSWSNRNATVLNNLISDLGTSPATVMIDDGEWTIDTDVTFPTNLTVWVTSHATFDVATNITLTINGILDADCREIFTGTGTVTGTPTIIHLCEDWGIDTFGDVNEVTQIWDKDENDDLTTNNFVSIILGNWPDLDTTSSNDLNSVTVTSPGTTGTAYVTNGTNLVITFPQLVTFDDTVSTINGLQLEYSNTTTVTITPGAGIVGTNYFAVNSATNVNLSGILPSGFDFAYVYVDESASTFPTNLTFFGDTQEPEWNADYLGYYHPVNTLDRMVGMVMTPSTGSTIARFDNSGLDFILVEENLVNHDNDDSGGGGSDNDGPGDWASPTTNTDTYSPVNAVAAYLFGYSDDGAPGTCTIAITTKEAADLDSPITLDGATATNARLQNHSYAEGGITGVLNFGPSRQSEYYAESDDDAFGYWTYGWRLKR